MLCLCCVFGGGRCGGAFSYSCSATLQAARAAGKRDADQGGGRVRVRGDFVGNIQRAPRMGGLQHGPGERAEGLVGREVTDLACLARHPSPSFLYLNKPLPLFLPPTPPNSLPDYFFGVHPAAAAAGAAWCARGAAPAHGRLPGGKPACPPHIFPNSKEPGRDGDALNSYYCLLFCLEC